MDLFKVDNTCIFCDLAFNLEARSPYYLPCNDHTACKQCLKNAEIRGDSVIHCPLDKIPLQLNKLKTLNKNTEIVKQLQAIESKKKNSKPKE